LPVLRGISVGQAFPPTSMSNVLTNLASAILLDLRNQVSYWTRHQKTGLAGVTWFLIRLTPKKAKRLPVPTERRFTVKNSPGTELFSQAVTHQVSSPQQRFTSEFGMGSVWFHRAKSTRKNRRVSRTLKTAQQLVFKSNKYETSMLEVKPSVC
jgi:hypothetical protein